MLRLPWTSVLSCLLHICSSWTLFACPLPYSPSLGIQNNRGGPHESKDKRNRLAICCIILHALYIEETKMCLNFRTLLSFFMRVHIRKMQIIKETLVTFSWFWKERVSVVRSLKRIGLLCWNKRQSFFNRLFLMQHQVAEGGLPSSAGCPQHDVLHLCFQPLSLVLEPQPDVIHPHYPLSHFLGHSSRAPSPQMALFLLLSDKCLCVDLNPGLQIILLSDLCPRQHKVLSFQFPGVIRLGAIILGELPSAVSTRYRVCFSLR